MVSLFRLFAVFVIAPAIVWGDPRLSWFKAEGPVGSEMRSFLVSVTVDSIAVYSGNQRKAPALIPNQTFPALQYSMEASYQGKDTSFWWNGVFILKPAKAGMLLDPVWASYVRGGLSENEWSLIRFQSQSPKVEFHSPVYGDGEHTLDANVIPEEAVFLLATKLAAQPGEIQIRMLAPAWEQSYTRKSFGVKAYRTEQKLKIDDVEAVLVRFERDDGAAAEVWVSTGAYRILRARTFRGLLLERLQ